MSPLVIRNAELVSLFPTQYYKFQEVFTPNRQFDKDFESYHQRHRNFPPPLKKQYYRCRSDIIDG
jgi:hypothetical protein